MIRDTVPARLLSYTLVLATGALVGLGAMTLVFGKSRHADPEEAVAVTSRSVNPLEHAAAPPEQPPHGGPETTGAAGEKPEPHPHEETGKHGGSETDKTRDKFSLFYDKFLSADCNASKHSEDGVQFGPDYFTVFVEDRRVRYIEGYYQFDPHGMKFIFGDQYILFNIDNDFIVMSEILIEGVAVTVTPAVKWKVCPSPPRERPGWQLPILGFEAGDGLLFALKTEDREAINHYLAKGGYVPARPLKTVLEATGLDDRTAVRITEISARNEEADARRKAAEAARPKPKPSKPAAAPAKKSGH